MHSLIESYSDKLSNVLHMHAMQQVPVLAADLQRCWKDGNCVYICGNGGSAGNAMHLANDFLCWVGGRNGTGIRVEALSANAADITCLANALGYKVLTLIDRCSK